ncbi:MAG: alpha/beta hydrolase [Actinomycetota bacterium]|nr:alpha/beta hydrolase [Actinomycetota bacterium]
MADLGAATVETPLGEVDYEDDGQGPPVLFVHGSPGGSDQGALMGGFLVSSGLRVIAPSRPGYLRTPLSELTATPDAQADLLAAVMEALGIVRFAVVCWSGGGPSAYRLAARYPERVTALVSLAGVSRPYRFEHPHEEGLLTGRVGKWMMKEMMRHSPKGVVKMMAGEEGDLTKEQLKELAEHIWSEPAKRAFVLELMATVSGDRKAGLHNDQKQFPAVKDLELSRVQAATLLVHGTVDTDVPPDNSQHALAEIPRAEIVWIDNGTHIATWTDPTSDAIQARITEFLGP